MDNEIIISLINGRGRFKSRAWRSIKYIGDNLSVLDKLMENPRQVTELVKFVCQMIDTPWPDSVKIEEIVKVIKAHQWVKTDPEIMGGTPCVTGTRIPARQIAVMYNMGESVEGLLEGYPSLCEESIEASLDWAKVHPQPTAVPKRPPWRRKYPRRKKLKTPRTIGGK